MITPKHETVDRLFSEYIFSVPKYQRAYVWKQSAEVNDFWEDLLDQFQLELKLGIDKEKSNFFLGTIILHKTKHDSFMIVDGQQRMTTIYILLCAIRVFVDEKIKQSEGDLNQLDNLRRDLLNKISSSKSWKASSEGSVRLESTPQISDTIKLMSRSDWNGEFDLEILGSKEIKPIFNTFLQNLKESIPIENISEFINALYTASLISIEIEDISEAYLLFERTNARGATLGTADLLKNHLFANVSDESLKIEEFWSSITERCNNQLPKMLRYFYISRQGPVAASKLYKELKNYAKNDAEKLVLEIDQFSDFFDIFNKPNDLEALREYFYSKSKGQEHIDNDRLFWIYESLNALDFFNMKQPIPMIYSFIESFYRLKLYDKDLFDKRHSKTVYMFIEALENFHFINNFICNHQTNEVEKLYAATANKFFNAKNSTIFEKILHELYKSLKELLAKEGEFTENFVAIRYDQKTTKNLHYIYDRFNHKYEIDGKPWITPQTDWKQTQIFDNNLGRKKSSITIEHWYPQKPKTPERDEDYENFIHHIGNLLPLSSRINNKLDNLSPAEKYKVLNKNPELNSYNHNIEFINKYSPFERWGGEEIYERGNELAKRAYKIVWKFNPPMLEPK